LRWTIPVAAALVAVDIWDDEIYQYNQLVNGQGQIVIPLAA